MRAGTRFFKRGADLMAMLQTTLRLSKLLYTTKRTLPLFKVFLLSWSYSSHSRILIVLQPVRGSVPAIWQQQICLKYEPSIEVHDPQDEISLKVFLQHFEKQISIYGRQTIVSLLKKSGGESRLGTAYEVLFHKCDEHKQNGNLCYHSFDLHKECGMALVPFTIAHRFK